MPTSLPKKCQIMQESVGVYDVGSSIGHNSLLLLPTCPFLKISVFIIVASANDEDCRLITASLPCWRPRASWRTRI